MKSITQKMKKSFIFFILSTVLLIEQSLGDTKIITPSHELTPNGKDFRNAVLTKLVILTEEPIKLGKKLFTDTIADKSNSEDVTKVLTNSLSKLEDIDIDEPAGKIKVFLGFNLIFGVLSGRVNITDEGRRELIIAVKEAFEKHDLLNVANEFEREFDEFLEWFSQEFQEKGDKLTSEEQLRVNAFKDLLLEFKNETNMAKKNNALEALVSGVKL